jgi:XTP/dITP diphosphohydrolase
MYISTKQLVFATQNTNKIIEVQEIIDDSFSLLSLRDINFYEDIPEDFFTLEENALFKSRFISNTFGYNCFSDDTGLEVESLNGEPGVFSARYAGNEKDSDSNIRKLLQNLEGEKNRKAQFRTVIALIINGKEHLFEGIVKGIIAEKPKGMSGFGYDPVFIPDGHSQTFAEMNLSIKNIISHRSIAIKKLSEFLLSQK